MENIYIGMGDVRQAALIRLEMKHGIFSVMLVLQDIGVIRTQAASQLAKSISTKPLKEDLNSAITHAKPTNFSTKMAVATAHVNLFTLKEWSKKCFNSVIILVKKALGSISKMENAQVFPIQPKKF